MPYIYQLGHWMDDSPYKLSKKPKGTAEMFPPASEDPIPDKYLTSSSFKIHSFPVPLLLNSNNFIHVISQYLKKYWGHFSDLLIFLVTLKQEKEYLDQNFLFSSSFRKSLWLLITNKLENFQAASLRLLLVKATLQLFSLESKMVF